MNAADEILAAIEKLTSQRDDDAAIQLFPSESNHPHHCALTPPASRLTKTLRATIDAQLSILRDAHFMLTKYGDVGNAHGLALARAINEGTES